MMNNIHYDIEFLMLRDLIRPLMIDVDTECLGWCRDVYRNDINSPVMLVNNVFYFKSEIPTVNNDYFRIPREIAKLIK